METQSQTQTQTQTQTPLPYSRREEVWSGAIHGAGIVLSVAGLAVLVRLSTLRGDAWTVASTTVFSLSMIVLYTASTLYHAARETRRKRRLKKFDHISIYFLIAGTYTPFLLTVLRGRLGWVLFGVIWGLALLGTCLKLLMGGSGTRWWSVGLYLAMGWLIVLASGRLFPLLPREGVLFLMLGGVFYTAGLAFYLRKSRPYTHAVWHGFVLAGTAMHFLSILYSCVPAA